MASRLAEQHEVLLLEAGPKHHAWDFRVHMPAALSEVLTSTAYNYGFHTESEAELGNRRLYCPRGRVLGGSSSINGMIFVRGNPSDFDRWETRYGCTGWGYQSVLPHFKRSEDRPGGDPLFRGLGGPQRVQSSDVSGELNQAWLAAGSALGFPSTEDFNGAEQEGFGPFDASIADGRRQSTAVTYLDGRSSPGLTVQTGVTVNRLEFVGDQCVGVSWVNRKGGRPIQSNARKETVLCAGAIGTPQVLIRSGIGPEQELKRLAIPPVWTNDDIGEHLQDHLEIYVQAGIKKPVSIYPSTRGLGKLRAGVEWYLLKSGAGATNHFHAGAFLRSGLDAGYPDLQFHFLPIAMNYDGSQQVNHHGVQAHVGPMKPLSRGRVSIQSSDPFSSPQIQFNYLSAEEDWAVMRRGIRLAEALLGEQSFQSMGAWPLKRFGSDAELDEWIRLQAESAYHPCGTCRMGKEGEAPVSPEGEVWGVRNLRVVDASLMPEITNGNLNAVVIMMAEKIAAQMLGVAV